MSDVFFDILKERFGASRVTLDKGRYRACIPFRSDQDVPLKDLSPQLFQYIEDLQQPDALNPMKSKVMRVDSRLQAAFLVAQLLLGDKIEFTLTQTPQDVAFGFRPGEDMERYIDTLRLIVPLPEFENL